MVIFLVQDCHFLGRVGNSITWDELVMFLGRDDHRLTNSANEKYWGDGGMNFVFIGGMGSNYWGDIPPSPLLRHRCLHSKSIPQLQSVCPICLFLLSVLRPVLI